MKPQNITNITNLLLNQNDELPDGACFLVELPEDMKKYIHES